MLNFPQTLDVSAERLALRVELLLWLLEDLKNCVNINSAWALASTYRRHCAQKLRVQALVESLGSRFPELKYGADRQLDRERRGERRN
jgi:hypothetical protein